MSIYTTTLNKINELLKDNPAKVEPIKALKYFWRTSKSIEVPNVLNGKVLGTKTIVVPDQGQYIKSI